MTRTRLPGRRSGSAAGCWRDRSTRRGSGWPSSPIPPARRSSRASSCRPIATSRLRPPDPHRRPSRTGDRCQTANTDLMSVSATGGPLADAARQFSRWWWLWLVAGIFWILAALVVLQFDQASITTVGVLIGILFLVTSAEQFAIGTLIQSGWRWMFWIFGTLFLAAGIISFVHPENTFHGV